MNLISALRLSATSHSTRPADANWQPGRAAYQNPNEICGPDQIGWPVEPLGEQSRQKQDQRKQASISE
jgi:hypothetical protein